MSKKKCPRLFELCHSLTRFSLLTTRFPAHWCVFLQLTNTFLQLIDTLQLTDAFPQRIAKYRLRTDDLSSSPTLSRLTNTFLQLINTFPQLTDTFTARPPMHFVHSPALSLITDTFHSSPMLFTAPTHSSAHRHVSSTLKVLWCSPTHFPVY